MTHTHILIFACALSRSNPLLAFSIIFIGTTHPPASSHLLSTDRRLAHTAISPTPTNIMHFETEFLASMTTLASTHDWLRTWRVEPNLLIPHQSAPHKKLTRSSRRSAHANDARNDTVAIQPQEHLNNFAIRLVLTHSIQHHLKSH